MTCSIMSLEKLSNSLAPSRPTEKKSLEMGPAICDLTGPDNSDAGQNLRTSNLD